MPDQSSGVALASLVAHELNRDPELGDYRIDVAVEDGVIVLRGVVATDSSRTRAEASARRVPGVRDVANDLVLGPCGADGRSDAAIAADVRHALERDPRVPHQRITTSVSAGRVTLAGDADHWPESRAAEAIAAGVIGVRGVENAITVAECVSPREVHRAIVEALTRQALEEAKALDVASFRGDVTVSGEISSPRAKRALLAAAAAVPGVRTVKSFVRIPPAEHSG